MRKFVTYGRKFFYNIGPWTRPFVGHRPDVAVRGDPDEDGLVNEPELLPGFRILPEVVAGREVRHHHRVPETEKNPGSLLFGFL
jgi:hypothetical protein